MTWNIAAVLLLLSGDVELNPGPKKGAPKQEGPTPEQKMAEMSATMAQYEEKIKGNFLRPDSLQPQIKHRKQLPIITGKKSDMFFTFLLVVKPKPPDKN